MTPYKKTTRKKRASSLIRELNKLFPNAKLVLNYRKEWDLLVAVRLSAQCTDKKVNEVTKHLFKKYKKIDDYISANQTAFEKDIYQTGFYKSKARDLLRAAKFVKEDYGGRLPQNMSGMLKIPGVARKSANVLLGNLFGVTEGVVVDTHMLRFAIRFNLSDYKDPVRVERDLMEVIPKKEWFSFSYKVVEYGRSYGASKGDKELHKTDPLIKIYKKAKNYWPKY